MQLAAHLRAPDVAEVHAPLRVVALGGGVVVARVDVANGLRAGGCCHAAAVYAATLAAREPVVEKRVAPRERVRIGKQTVTEERVVTEELRPHRKVDRVG